MVQITEQAAPTQVPGAAPAASDRRRPGRNGAVNPALLPLLRQDDLLNGPLVPHADDDLAPVRGIGVSVLLGTLLWAGLIVALYWLFTR